MADKNKELKKKHANGKANNSVGGLKVYKVNGVKKEDKKARREKAVQTFLIVLIVILAIAAIFSAIKTFFPNWFGRFSLQGELAARVNGQPITMSQLDLEYERLPLQYKYFITKEAFLTQLIDEVLLNKEAAKQGLSVTEQEVDESLNKFMQENNMTKEKLDQLLTEKKLTEAELRSLVKNQLLIDKLLKQEVNSKVNVTTEMMLQYYNENSDSFRVPEMVTVRHILVGLDNRTDKEAEVRVNTVMKELKADKSNFCELVSLYSDDSGSLDTCGEYIFPRGQMVEEFEKVAFEQGLGKVSIVKTTFGYHVLWTINKTAEEIINFKDVQEQITLTLEGQQQKMLYSELIVRLREKAEVINYLEQKEKELAEKTAKQAEENKTEETEGAVQLVVEEKAAEEKKEPEITIESVEETKEVVVEQKELEKEIEPAVEEVVEEKPVVTLGFAECLTSKGATLYGAYWDSSTKKQKDYFGAEIAKISYVECGVQGDFRAQDKVCEDAGILAYPTWVVNNQKHMGIQTLQQLAQLTGCKI